MSKSLLFFHNMIMYRDSSMKQKVSPDLILFLCYLSGVHFSVTNNPFSLHTRSLNISKHEKKREKDHFSYLIRPERNFGIAES
jgi:hypothetical protein